MPQCACDAERGLICLAHLIVRYMEHRDLKDLALIIRGVRQAREQALEALDRQFEKLDHAAETFDRVAERIARRENEIVVQVLESVFKMVARELVRRKYEGRHRNMNEAFAEMVDNMNLSDEERAHFSKMSDGTQNL